jgi:hypothetical protein
MFHGLFHVEQSVIRAVEHRRQRSSCGVGVTIKGGFENVKTPLLGRNLDLRP